MTATETHAPATPRETGLATVASLAQEWGQRNPTQIALRAKDLGIWQEFDWATTWDLIETAAHALLAYGVEPGERVSIHAENRPEWVIVDLATVAIRATTVGLYPTSPVGEVEHVLLDSGSTVHIVEDQEQTDKVFDLDPATTSLLRAIVYLEPRGFAAFDDQRLVFWDEFLEAGRQHRLAHPGAVAQRMAEAQDNDVIALAYTAGTSGPPKGAMLTNANAMFAIEEVIRDGSAYPSSKAPHPGDEILSYLPLCDVAERLFSTWTLVGGGSTLNFAESIETVAMNLSEAQPTLFFGVPRIWERLHATLHVRSGDASAFKGLLLKGALKAAARIGRAKAANNGSHTVGSRVLHWIFFPLVFRALQERVGLRECRRAISGTAPIAPEVLEFFMGIGVDIYELYGTTENSAIGTLNYPGRMKLGTVGEPIHGTELRIGDTHGEIQCKHPGVFAGYWQRPEDTAAAFTEDGWLRTGDVGEWVDGSHVRIVDRIEDVILTADGRNVSPSKIEKALKASPLVKEAMVIGHERSHLTALIAIDMEVVGNWALRNKVPFTTYRDLTEKAEVIDLVQDVVDSGNAQMTADEGVKSFTLIPKELDHEDGELTAMQKLKRSAVLDQFGDLVEAMYR